MHWGSLYPGSGVAGGKTVPEGRPAREHDTKGSHGGKVGRAEKQRKQLPSTLFMARRPPGTSQPCSFFWAGCFGSNLCPHAEGSWDGGDGDLSAEELGFSVR